jgi:hypothetical protein
MPAAAGAAAAGPDTSHHDHHDTLPRAQTLIEGDALLVTSHRPQAHTVLQAVNPDHTPSAHSTT